MFPSSFTAVYDACVLYPATVRDLLMELATTGLFRARWSAEIHEEWIRAVLRRRPDLSRQALEGVRDKMDQNVLDCLVTGYEDLVPGLALPDPDDRHVLAAAIRSQAGVIVTCNLGDFPGEILEKHQVEAQHPDEFILYLLDLEPRAVCAAAARVRGRWRHPPATREEFLERLRRAGLPQSAEALSRHCRRL